MKRTNKNRDLGFEDLRVSMPPYSVSRPANPEYERPVILSHSGEDILKELGPAQACYPFNSCGISP